MEVAKAIAKSEKVYMLADECHIEEVKNSLKENMEAVIIESDDAWARDVGPTYVVDDKGNRMGINWKFNAWGGSFDGLYMHYDKDDKVASRFLKYTGDMIFDAHPFVLEGGSIHSDGEGTILTTGKQEILVRFFHGRFNQRGKTNLYGHSDDWDQDRQRFVIPKVRMMTEEKRKEIQELQNLNSELDAISRYLLDAFVAAGSGKVPLPNKWVADKLLERTVESLDLPAVEDAKEDESAEEKNDLQKEFFDTFEHFVSIQKISISRIRHYNVIIRALKRFAIYSAQEVSFATLSSDLLRKFSKFLENEHKFVVEGKDGKPCIKDPLYKKAYKSVPECRFPKQRGLNSIIGTMSRFHTFVRWSIKRGYLNRDPYDDYVIGTAIYGTPFYLTKEERNQLYQAEFPDNPGLEVQRDIFVFQCFIGSRVGDLMKLTKDNVINGAIEYVPRKTKEGRPYTVRVPLSPTALEILDRYKD